MVDAALPSDSRERGEGSLASPRPSFPGFLQREASQEVHAKVPPLHVSMLLALLSAAKSTLSNPHLDHQPYVRGHFDEFSIANLESGERGGGGLRLFRMRLPGRRSMCLFVHVQVDSNPSPSPPTTNRPHPPTLPAARNPSYEQQELMTQHGTLLDESARLAETAKKLELNAAADAPAIAQNIRVGHL